MKSAFEPGGVSSYVGSFPGYSNIKRLGVFILNGMLVAGLSPAINSPVLIYTPGPREHITVSPTRLEPGPLEPESSALTIRLRTSHKRTKKCRYIFYIFLKIYIFGKECNMSVVCFTVKKTSLPALSESCLPETKSGREKIY